MFKKSWDDVVRIYRSENMFMFKMSLVKSTEVTTDEAVDPFNFQTDLDTSGLRDEEIIVYSSINEEYTIYAYFNNRKVSILNGYLGLGRTLLVCLVLGISTYLLSRDAEKLVIQPIESMMTKVDRISENPLEAAEIEEKNIIEVETANQMEQKKKGKVQPEENYEPSVLQKVIVKIGALLAIGFGEAGSEIIAANMAKSGSVDPMLQGKKMFGVFGFCDIRNFTDATEILKKEVMDFVNEIAHIVHSIVDMHFGTSNKNIGDAFLLVWKVPESELEVDENGQIKAIAKFRTKLITDLSILSFIKIISEISKSKVLSKYRENKMLSDRLGSDYRVRMGFGLHLGWAIEGAIGSKYKIDASYLSPNVNMAARLEAATKQFGVQLLIR